MNDKDHKHILELMVDIGSTFGLNDWTLGISSLPPTDDMFMKGTEAIAETTVTKFRQVATFKFTPDFLKMGHKVILETLVHELMHLHFVRLKWACEDLESLRAMSDEAFGQFIARCHEAEEMAVDRLSNGMATYLWDNVDVQKKLRKITKQVERTVD